MVERCGQEMRRWGSWGRCGWTLLGLALIAVGYGGWSWWQPVGRWLPEMTLHAATATQNESYAMATGAIDDEVEGVYMLNFITGDLQCSVLSNRAPSMGKFVGMFKTNVIKDLGLDANKRPAYLMTTGQISFPRGAGAAQPAMSVVYVLDSASGNFAAYGLPWRRDLASTGRPQIGQLTLLDVAQGPAAIERD